MSGEPFYSKIFHLGVAIGHNKSFATSGGKPARYALLALFRS